MKPLVPLTLVLGLATLAGAQEPAPATETPAAPAQDVAKPSETAQPQQPLAAPMKEEFVERVIEVGGEVVDLKDDKESSRFREYRSVHEGFVVPYLKFGGQGDYRWDVTASKVGQDDMRARGFLSGDSFDATASWTRVPHNFGDNGRELVGGGVYGLAAQNQAVLERQFATNRTGINFAFLSALLAPQIEQAPVVDVGLQRDFARLELDLLKDGPVTVQFVYAHEERDGGRQSGTSFGFGNVVETIEPIDYRTQDVALQAQYGVGKATLSGAVRYNRFTNANLSQTFGNPFRATDASDSGAYQAPNSSSIAGAAVGRIALPPTNQGLTGTLGLRYRFNDRNRLKADVSYGRITQDEDFIPYANNASITTSFRATDVSALPQRSLDGQLNILSVNATFNSRLTDALSLNLRARRYDLDNKTEQIEFPLGYVRFDGGVNATGRISVPYGYGNDRASAALTYTFDKASLEGGWRVHRASRTYRETEHTTENTFFASGTVRPSEKLQLRATAEFGSRDFDHYDAAHSEHASFLGNVAMTNQDILIRPDQAKRDLKRYFAQAEFTPIDEVVVSVGYLRQEQDYTDSPLGLQTADADSLTGEVDVQPNDRVNLFGFYTKETQTYFQIGRQSGATPSALEADNWTSEQDYDGDSFGVGAGFVLVPDKVKVTVNATRQEINALNDFEVASATGLPGAARAAFGGQPLDIEDYDDTKLTTLNAELAYTFRGGFTFGVGGWHEKYDIDDAATQDVALGRLPNFTPGGLFIAGDDGDYEATVFYSRLSYAW